MIYVIIYFATKEKIISEIVIYERKASEKNVEKNIFVEIYIASHVF